MTKEEKDRLEFFCFDVLGDFMETNAYEIRETGKGEAMVLVRYKGLVYTPDEVIFDEWKDKAKGTEFEKVKLLIAK